MEPTDSKRCDNLTDEQRAILNNQAAASCPQPIDYGLTYEETFNGLYLRDGRFREETPECGVGELKYKQGEWIRFWSGWAVAIWFPLYILGFAAVVVLNPDFPDGWTWSNPRAFKVFFLGMVMPGFFPGFFVISGVVHAVVESYKRRHPSAGLLAYRQALCLHRSYVAAAREAEQIELALLKQKRSYWESLNGYEFERATAEVLEKHQFNPKVTGGSADGGIDIEVTRGGQKGVVQCKAHVTSVAPHTVRDLFGVMHHSSSDFGIVVSLGGFTKAAIEFAQNKPIFLLDSSDLIAMQEGQDILAEKFHAGLIHRPDSPDVTP